MSYPAPKRLAPQAKAQNQTVPSQTSDDEVTLTVSVTNKRLWPLSGLSKEAFTLMADKSPLEITSFSNNEAPQSVGVILDMSGSMDGKKSARHAMQFLKTS